MQNDIQGRAAVKQSNTRTGAARAKAISKIIVAGVILAVGTSLAIAPAAARPGAEASALGNVYTTNDWGDLKVTEWDEARFGADYSFERGRIEGVRKGNEISGYWSQSTSDRACDVPRDGSYHYGRMTFTFNAELDAFEGRWGYCDETPYATWDGSLTRRGKAGNSAPEKPAVREKKPASATQGTPGQAEAPQAFVYATVGFDKIKPELVLDTSAAPVTGTYTATQSEAELDDIYRTGTYGITSGTLEGQFAGNVLSGYWYETAYNAGLQGYCDDERNGTRVYGRFVLAFSADRKSFTGLRTSCEIVPDAYEHSYNTWNGTLVRRQPVTPSTTASARPSVGSSGARSTTTFGAESGGRIAGNAASAAEDEVSAKAEEAARKATRGILDRVF